MPSILTITTSYPSPRSAVAGVFVREHVAARPRDSDAFVLHLERSADLRGLVVEHDRDDVAEIVRVRFPEQPTVLSYLALLAAGLVGFRAVRKRGFAPDLLHAHFLTGAVPTALLAAIHRLPFVVTENWSVFLDDDPARLSPVMLEAARIAFRRAAVVMPASEALARGIEAHGIDARIRVVPNPVDLSAFKPPPPRPAQSPVRLLTVALFYPAKGVDLLLDAVALLREQRGDFRVDVVGDGELRAEYESLRRRKRLEDVVEFRGRLAKEQVAELMRDADLYVLPSRFDNNPVALLEARATGLPCVATRVGGVPEIVDADGILTAPEPRAIADGIAAALEQLPEHDRAATARRAAERYGIPAVSAALGEIYAAALERRGTNERASQRHATGDHGRDQSA